MSKPTESAGLELEDEQGKYFRAIRSSRYSNLWILTLWGLDFHQLIEITSKFPEYEIRPILGPHPPPPFQYYLQSSRFKPDIIVEEFIFETLDYINSIFGLKILKLNSTKNDSHETKMKIWTLSEK